MIQDRIKAEVIIPWINFKCDWTWSAMHLMETLGNKEFEEVNELYTELYVGTAQDIRKCPIESWNYAGLIDQNTCSNKLQCLKWNYTWREYSQMSFIEKSMKSAREIVNLNSESYSYFNQIFTGSPCPKWGLVIWKDGGCNHMVCKKWNYEFCWLWQGYYPSYRHTTENFWFLRKLMTTVFLSTLIIFLDLKLSRYVPFISDIQYNLYFYAWYTIAPNVFAILFIFEFILIALARDCWRDYAAPVQRSMKTVFIISSILFPLGYFFICYNLYYSEEWYFIIHVLFCELLVVVFTSLNVIIIYFSILAVIYFVFIPIGSLLNYICDIFNNYIIWWAKFYLFMENILTIAHVSIDWLLYIFGQRSLHFIQNDNDLKDKLD